MRRAFGLAAVYALALTSGLQAQTLVNSSIYAANGHLYEVYDAPMITWADAQAFAAARGGYLATITDAGENAFVGNLNYAVSPGQRWLGGFQPPDERNPLANWQWVTGEAWVYTNWAAGEPNDTGSIYSELEQHLTIGRFSDDPLGWNDEGNLSLINGFIVEYVPEPASMVALSVGLAGLIGLRRRRK
jgi:hypothetical protein